MTKDHGGSMENSKIIAKAQKYLEDISIKYPIELAYVFGSVSVNQNNAMSDIDIGVKFKNKYTDLEDALIRGEIIDKGEAVLKMPVDVVSLDKASVFLKYQIVKDGKVLIDSENRATIESLILREYFDFKYYSDIFDEALIKSLKEETYSGG